MNRMKATCIFFIGFLFVFELRAKSFFVAPSASVLSDGTIAQPWGLQQALNHPAALKPGDTVWLRGGVYLNAFDAQTSFSCYTKGTANAPIIFRNYKDERAIIDGNLVYSLYVGLGNSYHTWFWGIEVTNTFSITRNQEIGGGVTCTAENIKFINMIIHDTGHGLDVWKTAKDAELYGNIVYHIGNNLNNNGNLEGHGHGLYLQNDTFGIKSVYNNIIFSNYGNGIKIWQTTTTAALGNFDIQRNIVFNGGSASENLGGVGNNSRTHNFFVLSNGSNNPLVNTVIKHNYTYSGLNTPRPPVNAFGLNHGVRNFVLDSNYLTCQTRLGFNNTPIFDASVKGNKIIAGIPSVYGYYLWGFSQIDFPDNEYIAELPQQGLEYFVLPNKYDQHRSHLVIYNWDSTATVGIDISNTGMLSGDNYELINVMDPFNDTIRGVCPGNGSIQVPMTGHSFAKPMASHQIPASQFPKFGVFIVRKNVNIAVNMDEPILKSPEIIIKPNPTSGVIELHNLNQAQRLELIHVSGETICKINNISGRDPLRIDLTGYPKGLYYFKIYYAHHNITKNLLIH